MSETKKFEVMISLSVKEEKGGQPTDFFDNVLTYHDIGYDGVVMVEKVLLEALQKLNEMGMVQAASMGLGDRLASLGLGEKLASLGIGPAKK